MVALTFVVLAASIFLGTAITAVGLHLTLRLLERSGAAQPSAPPTTE